MRWRPSRWSPDCARGLCSASGPQRAFLLPLIPKRRMSVLRSVTRIGVGGCVRTRPSGSNMALAATSEPAFECEDHRQAARL